MGMFNNAVPIAQQVCKIIDLSDNKHMLDMGGGPGTYAIHFCQAEPAAQGHSLRSAHHQALCSQDH